MNEGVRSRLNDLPVAQPLEGRAEWARFRALPVASLVSMLNEAPIPAACVLVEAAEGDLRQPPSTFLLPRYVAPEGRCNELSGDGAQSVGDYDLIETPRRGADYVMLLDAVWQQYFPDDVMASIREARHSWDRMECALVDDGSDSEDSDSAIGVNPVVSSLRRLDLDSGRGRSRFEQYVTAANAVCNAYGDYCAYRGQTGGDRALSWAVGEIQGMRSSLNRVLSMRADQVYGRPLLASGIVRGSRL